MNQTMRGLILPGNSTAELREFPVPDSRARRGADPHEELDHLRVGHPVHLPPASRQGARRLPAGHDRRARAVRPGRGRRARLPPLQGGRSRHRLPHLRVWRVQRLPARLHDLVHERLPARLRVAASRRHGRLHAGRGEGPRPAARVVDLLGRRAGGVRVRDRVRGHRTRRRQRQRRGAGHGTRAGRPRDRDALPSARGAPRDRDRHPAGTAAVGDVAGAVRTDSAGRDPRTWTTSGR